SKHRLRVGDIELRLLQSPHVCGMGLVQKDGQFAEHRAGCQYLRGRRLLLQRLVALAAELLDVRVLCDRGRTAMTRGFRRTAAPRLKASNLPRFRACLTPSH